MSATQRGLFSAGESNQELPQAPAGTAGFQSAVGQEEKTCRLKRKHKTEKAAEAVSPHRGTAAMLERFYTLIGDVKRRAGAMAMAEDFTEEALRDALGQKYGDIWHTFYENDRAAAEKPHHHSSHT